MTTDLDLSGITFLKSPIIEQFVVDHVEYFRIVMLGADYRGPDPLVPISKFTSGFKNLLSSFHYSRIGWKRAPKLVTERTINFFVMSSGVYHVKTGRHSVYALVPVTYSDVNYGATYGITLTRPRVRGYSNISILTVDSVMLYSYVNWFCEIDV